MSDFALGIIVLTFVAVPISLLILALADVIRLDGEGSRRRWIRNCLYALALPAAVPFGIAAWGWAGAAHLEPLCQAYASPEFRTERPLEVSVLILEGDHLRRGADLPPWAKTLKTSLQRAPKSLDIIVVPREIKGPFIPQTQDALRLSVDRKLHHENRWFRVEMERFTLIDTAYGSTVAIADELSIDAGRSRYRCGILSGKNPTGDSRYPAGNGIARFVERAISGVDARRAP